MNGLKLADCQIPEGAILYTKYWSGTCIALYSLSIIPALPAPWFGSEQKLCSLGCKSPLFFLPYRCSLCSRTALPLTCRALAKAKRGKCITIESAANTPEGGSFGKITHMQTPSPLSLLQKPFNGLRNTSSHKVLRHFTEPRLGSYALNALYLNHSLLLLHSLPWKPLPPGRRAICLLS